MRCSIATDDERIEERCAAFGATVGHDGPDCASGTDRVHEALKGSDADIVVNLQGDEPEIRAGHDRRAHPGYREENLEMATLCALITDPRDYKSPHVVKFVLDKNGFALYFSRAPLPFLQKTVSIPFYKHIGIYAFSRAFLETFVALPKGRLEEAESLEQLRALEAGYGSRPSSSSTRASASIRRKTWSRCARQWDRASAAGEGSSWARGRRFGSTRKVRPDRPHAAGSRSDRPGDENATSNYGVPRGEPRAPLANGSSGRKRGFARKPQNGMIAVVIETFSSGLFSRPGVLFPGRGGEHEPHVDAHGASSFFEDDERVDIQLDDVGKVDDELRNFQKSIGDRPSGPPAPLAPHAEEQLNDLISRIISIASSLREGCDAERARPSTPPHRCLRGRT